MNYKNINSKVVLGYIDNDYSIDSTDWINRSPLWIHSCMADLGCFPMLKQIYSENVTVANYMAKIPCDLKLLDAVIYNNYRLPLMGKSVGRHTALVPYTDHPEQAYELRGDSYIITTFEDGTVNFVYRAIPVEQDPDSGVWFPLIPDKYEVIEAMQHFILMKIIQKGYSVEGFSLKDNNPATNPYLAYYGNERIGIVGSQKKARNAMVNMDPDHRKLMSDITRTFIYDYNRYDREFLQNTI